MKRKKLTHPQLRGRNANRVWQQWIETNYPKLDREHWIPNVTSHSIGDTRRGQFEHWLMSQGCYLGQTNGEPEIFAFDEQHLTLFVLKWAL